MAFQPFSLNGWASGSVLVGEPDAIAPDALRLAQNVRLDRTLRVVEPRPGWRRRTTAALTVGITFLTRLFTRTLTYGYVQSGRALVRTNAAWVAQTSPFAVGTDVLSDVNAPDGRGAIWKILVNRGVALKVDGTSGFLPLGIPAPGAAPLGVSLATDLQVVIDSMHNQTNWTGTNLFAGPFSDIQYFQVGASSTTFFISASTFGSIASHQTTPVNLDLIPGGDALVKQDDYIHIWLRFDHPEWVVFVQLDVDIDAATTSVADAFRNNYYSVRVGPARLNQGEGTWTRLQVRKSEFSRIGTDPNRSWAHAQTFRIGVQTNNQGVVQVHASLFILRGGIGLEGQIRYTACYRSSATMARGNPPKDASFIPLFTGYITTDRQRLVVDLSNICASGGSYTGNASTDTLLLFRQGGTFAEPALAATISTGLTAHTDAASDETLILTNILLELDNDMPPADTTGSPRVVFGPDATGHYFLIVDGYKVFVSKPYETLENRVENWPRLGYFLIGDGSSKALAGCCEGAQVYVWTDAWTSSVVGVGAETYLPVQMDGSRGIVGQHAWTAGAGFQFFVSQDGIYVQDGQQQRKITQAIDPFFQGRDIDGQPGWEPTPAAMALVRLAFLHEPTGSLLVMVYVERGASILNRLLILKPNIQDGVLRECFFDFSSVTTPGALYLDDLARELLAGGQDGHIYQLEDPTQTTDAGSGIQIHTRFQSMTCQAPTRQKYINSAMVEGTTGGQALTVRLVYNRGALSEDVGTWNAPTETGLSFFQAGNPRVFRDDVAVDISGTVTSRFAITRVAVLAELQPERVTFFDSGDIVFPFVTQLKTLILDINAPAQQALTLTIDQQVVVTTLTVLATDSRMLLRLGLGPGLRGKVFRLTLASALPFVVYKVVGLVKQLGIEHEYTEHLFMQGT